MSDWLKSHSLSAGFSTMMMGTISGTTVGALGLVDARRVYEVATCGDAGIELEKRFDCDRVGGVLAGEHPRGGEEVVAENPLVYRCKGFARAEQVQLCLDG